MHTPRTIIAATILIGLAPSNAQQKPTLSSGGLEKISAHHYRLGKILIDTRTRRIEFPAKLEMNGEQLIEYLLVTNKGKSHESIFITDIRPFNLNLAFKLLNYRENQNMFAQQATPGPIPTKPNPATSVLKIEVNWKHQGQSHSIPLSQCVQHLQTRQSPQAAWIYTGSRIIQNQLSADKEGNVFALQIDQGALANAPVYHLNPDDLWKPNTQKLPPLGTSVRFSITPASVNQHP